MQRPKLNSSKHIQIVWFKRDLRIEDHRVLTQAAEQGPVLPLYVVEDELWREPDMSARQWAFIEECLHELRTQLHKIGQALVVRRGDVIKVLDDINNAFGFEALWSHEETDNAWTFTRDKRVSSWCCEKGKTNRITPS